MVCDDPVVVLVVGVITQFWVIPQNSLFSKKIKKKSKNQNQKNKIKAAKIGENQAAIFGRISRPNCTLLCPKIEKCKFKGQIK